MMYFDRYGAEIKRMSERKEARDGSSFKMMPFECSSNGMPGMFQWAKLRTRLDKLHAAVLGEVDAWRRNGAEQTQMLAEHHDAGVSSCIHHLRQQEDRIKHELPEGASIGADAANACVWVATLFGRAETAWDGGMFQVEMVFPPDFPDSPPFVHFLTPIFHPQVSPQGVPYLRSLVMWYHLEPKCKTVGSLVQQLVALLAMDPSPEPVTHLNLEARCCPPARRADPLPSRRRVFPRAGSTAAPHPLARRQRTCTSPVAMTIRSRTSGRSSGRCSGRWRCDDC